jgi:hypothetical protein
VPSSNITVPAGLPMERPAAAIRRRPARIDDACSFERLEDEAAAGVAGEQHARRSFRAVRRTRTRRVAGSRGGGESIGRRKSQTVPRSGLAPPVACLRACGPCVRCRAWFTGFSPRPGRPCRNHCLHGASRKRMPSEQMQPSICSCHESLEPSPRSASRRSPPATSASRAAC